jgi:hypothetical protein
MSSEDQLKVNQERLTIFNFIKDIVDKSAYEEEVGQYGLLTEKKIDLYKLEAILNEAKMKMKIHLVLPHKIKSQ